MRNLNFQVLVELRDRISTGISRITRSLRESTEQADRASEAGSRFATVCERLSRISLSASLMVAESYSRTLTDLTQKGTAFGQSMADLSAITGITGEELKKLEESSRRLGKDSGLGAGGIAESYKILASNIDVSKIGLDGLNEVQANTITLAQASGISMADAAQALAGTINQFGLSADEANRVINVLAAGSKYGAAEIPELAQSFKVVGAAASAAGLTVEQTAGAIEVLSKNNLKGAEAGTALRNIMLKMQTELGIDLGETGLSAALEALKPKLTDVSYLSKLFGMENIAAAQFLITNADAVEEMTERVTDSSVAQEQAAIRTETNAAKMERMRAAVDDVKIGFANMTGSLTPWIAVGGENLVLLAQMMPLLSATKTGVLAVATAENFKKITTLSGIAATKAAAIAMGILNAVMAANPVALIGLALIALVVAMMAAYNTCDDFREVVDQCWAAAKEFAIMIWDWLVEAFNAASEVLSKFCSALKSFFGMNSDAAGSAKNLAEAAGSVGTTSKKAMPFVLDFTKGLKEQGGQATYAAGTLGYYEKVIGSLRETQKGASVERAAELQREIRLLEQLSEKVRLAINLQSYTFEEATDRGISGSVKQLSVDPSLIAGTEAYGKKWETALSGVTQDIRKTSDQIKESMSQSVDFITSIWGDDSVIGSWADSAGRQVKRLQSIFVEFASVLKNDTLSGIQQVAGGLQATGAMMSEMGGIVGGITGAWLQYGASILGAIAQAIPAILAMMGIQIASTAVTVTDTNAKVANAAAGVLAANASLGPFGWIAGAAGVLGIVAAMAAIPKFANGGIVSGPTLAMVGEYPGASNDPEVIAPLSKLKSLIEPSGSIGGSVEFRIEGRALVGMLNKINNVKSRTR